MIPGNARIIDDYDHSAKNFRAPVKCPMGPVRFAGFSSTRRDPPEVTAARKARLNARIKDGALVPGSRFRERQLPYVKGRIGKTNVRHDNPQIV